MINYIVILFLGVLMVTNSTLYKYISISVKAELPDDVRDLFLLEFRAFLLVLEASVGLNYLELNFVELLILKVIYIK